MRKAMDELLKHAIVHDLGETAAQAGLMSVIQLANGVDPEDVAATAGIGFGTGMVARPAMAKIGGVVGRQMDKHMSPPINESLYNKAMTFIPSTRQQDVAMQRVMDDPKAPAGLKTIVSSLYPLAHKRMEAFYGPLKESMAKGGPIQGLYEGDMSVLARFFGDNVAQIGAGAITPAIMSTLTEE